MGKSLRVRNVNLKIIKHFGFEVMFSKTGWLYMSKLSKASNKNKV
tara:strand:- start:192 stop:326 length:135 start_codon:yes stop_codon:yes gene_type:complete